MKKNVSRADGSPQKRRLCAAALCSAVLLCFATGAEAQTSDLVQRSALRVCSDPANMPFSNEDREGFENKLAELIGDKLNLPVVYTWFPQATGFVRRTLRANKCDIIIGFSQGHELVQNTNHYYRSSYVLIHKTDGKLNGIKNLDDPRLKSSRIGAVAGTPPVTVLSFNELLTNLKPYPLMVDRRYDSPAERMITDLEKGEIDAALLWGPIGGYFAGRSKQKLTIIALSIETKGPRMSYRITFGIRPGETDWKHQLNELIAANQSKINAILLEYGVPLMDEKDQLIKQ
jgi:quinoprotein dehydrogenase-associated probable ABC transporter substrate-binding protein